uniref:Cyclin-dependent kinase 2-associated protein n=1 Tax=Ciona intestinalis TaxID=7719 RepID=H2XTI2_CIOIN
MSGKLYQGGSGQMPMYMTDSIPQSKYADLLAVIEELGKDIKPTYAGSRSASDRLKRGILHARALVRECLIETERSARS